MTKYNNYLTELSAELYTKLSHETVLVSQTGSGKTTLIFEHAERKVTEGKTVIIAEPTRALVNNKKVSAKDDIIKYAYGKEAVDNLSKGAQIIVTVYDTLVYLLQNDIWGDCTIYIDEAHKLITESDFRRKTLAELLDLRKKKRFEVILMTATPAALEKMGFEIINVEKEGANEVKCIDYHNTGNRHSITIATQIIQSADKKSLNTYRIQNKEVIGQLMTLAKSLNRRPIAIYSDGENYTSLKILNCDEKEAFNMLMQGKVASYITDIFSTSFTEEGLDFITGGRNVISHILPENGRYALPESILQQSSRYRDARNVQINAYGHFGQSDGKKATLGLNMASYSQNSSLILSAAQTWVDDRQDYTATATADALYHYNYKPNQKGVYKIDETKEQLRPSMRPINLLANAKNGVGEFEFDKCKTDAILKMLNIEPVSGNLNPEETVRLKGLLECLDDARLVDLPVSLYYNGKTFQEKKLINLATIGRCFSTEVTHQYSSLRYLFKEAYKRGKIMREDYLQLSSNEQTLLRTFCIHIIGVSKTRFSDSSLKRSNITVKPFNQWAVKLTQVRVPLGIPEKDW